jgi:hypothetical protein
MLLACCVHFKSELRWSNDGQLDMPTTDTIILAASQTCYKLSPGLHYNNVDSKQNLLCFTRLFILWLKLFTISFLLICDCRWPRTVGVSCSLNVLTVGHRTIVWGSKFQWMIVFGKNEYLYGSGQLGMPATDTIILAPSQICYKLSPGLHYNNVDSKQNLLCFTRLFTI